EYIGGRRAVLAVIGFDIAAADLDVPHLTADAGDAAAVVITYVAAGDINLMQIHLIHEDADAPVLIDMRLGDDHIAIPRCEMNAVITLADQHSGNREFHGPGGFDAVGFLVIADDLDAIHHRHPLLLPNIILHRTR